MKPTLQPGITRTETIRIDEARTIAFLGEEMRIYSTPSMVRDVEYTSLSLIDEHVDTIDLVYSISSQADGVP